MAKKENIQWLIGIDEAGRGPIAGPVTVGAVLIPYQKLGWFEKKFFAEGIKDSKKLTAKKRREILAELVVLQKEEKIKFTYCHVSAQQIDTKGINACVRAGIDKVLVGLEVLPDQCVVRLDGLLKAPEIFAHQTTIIKGDEREVVIALASVVAKVSRDELMTKLAVKYPDYGLDRHKGYGTRHHFKKIEEHGPCLAHRKSFLNRISDR